VICHVVQALVLAEYPDPRWSCGSKDLDLLFSCLLQTYKNDNPAPKPQLALPVRAVECAANHYNSKGKLIDFVFEIADLLTIAFFFLLRPGKYTMPTSCSCTRTVQFRQKDVQFFKHGNILPHNTPLDELQTADAAQLYIDNQKNGQRGSTLYHAARPGSFCPIKALENRVHY
jgi:hypothetical protein